FTVTRSGDTSTAATVNYTVTGGATNPANAGDFAGSAFPSGTVTFPIGSSSQVITINVSGDTVVESDETFSVTLSTPSAPATTITPVASGLSKNADSITLASAGTTATQLEGNSGPTAYTFTVTRSGDTSSAATVNYTVTGGATNPANAGDFAGSAF